MDAYIDAYVDDAMGTPAHLLTAQHQRWAIFLSCFHPIFNLFFIMDAYKSLGY